MTQIKFFGAAGTVSGSKYLIDNGKTRLLVDYGMFQGQKKLRLMNWEPPPVRPSTVDHVLLTHAHIDHSGMLPVLVREGFSGKIWSTPVTAELTEISLIDAAHLQEEDARFANKMKFTKHTPALPLFTKEDAERVFPHLRPLDYDKPADLPDGSQIRFRDAGHILGSATIELNTTNNGKPIRVVFSGDLGRYDALILRDPAAVDEADYLLIESTYGDRTHPPEDPVEELSAVIKETARRGGMLIIPSFAVGRTQTLLYMMRDMKVRASFRICRYLWTAPWPSTSPRSSVITSMILTRRQKRFFTRQASARFFVQTWNLSTLRRNLKKLMTCGSPPSLFLQAEWQLGGEYSIISIPVAGSAEYNSFCRLSVGWHPRADS